MASLREDMFGQGFGDFAVDLGTTTTRVYRRGAGIVLSQPSMVAFRRDEGGPARLLDAGSGARRMFGRTPAGIDVVRPLREGVVVDPAAGAQMLRSFFDSIPGCAHRSMRIIIGVPAGGSGRDRDNARAVARMAGAGEVYLMEEPLALAIGAGADAADLWGTLVVDVGGGTTEVALVASGGIQCLRSVPVGGDAMDAAIVGYLERERGVLVGERTAEELKIRLGAATDDSSAERTRVRGRGVARGLPVEISVSSREVCAALREPVAAIAAAVRSCLDGISPAVSLDLLDRGILMGGGGSLLRGLDRALEREVLLPVARVSDPFSCVARGSAAVLDYLGVLRRVEQG
ncbi:rod shape-determining protein [Geobacter sp. 60473]|uniref:rod shape-determining protein n=1 Tax=Geobacter sp. 60473 TaxID=3080755 RepID=UPI002B2F1D99|nr:rod shape-determining protein [Geobacter sp. 60473]